ncbi:MAG: UDP-glucose 4-epimerase GalE [Prevotellaceae bacterium]|jgi:UDP-glucose 4-epimerase|nr:UDP-glucose 4-epimerase GalE [Prevotellaceae bacterium]
MKEKILVTGGTGYIGSHTVVELQTAGYEVIVIDNLSNSTVDSLNGVASITGITPAFEKIDCCDKLALDGVFKKHQDIKAVIHFAASKAVGESVEKPLLYYRNNLVSLLNVLECMTENKVPNFVFSSSATVYGQPEILPVTEDAPVQPATSPYGNTKQIAEEVIRDCTVADANLKSVILRYFNPVGAHPSAAIGELPNGIPNNLIPFVTQTAIGLRECLSVFGDDYNTPDGSAIRDYIYVVDLAKAHVIAVERLLACANKTNPEIFNLGTGKGLSVLEILEVFEKATGVKVNRKIVARRTGDIEKVWADPSLANTELGWTAKTPTSEMLSSAWEWEKKLRDSR